MLSTATVDGAALVPTYDEDLDTASVPASTDFTVKVDTTAVNLARSSPMAIVNQAVLTPSLELGVRHDGGDPETGFGADIGAGLALSDPARGVSAELRARGLLTHEAKGIREGSLSGSTGRGGQHVAPTIACSIRR